jgi:enolase-phosphatase E1
MHQITAILLDIEGTTTPISFVHEVLFPFSRVHLTSYLAENSDSSDVSDDLGLLRKEHFEDLNSGNQPPPLIEQYVYWLIDQDRKSPALKSLQGKIWEQGYNDGRLHSPVFADVRPAIVRWVEMGVSVNIFSSGSVLAQRLLFAHTDAGDLTQFIDRYFDTGVGKKNNSESYQTIAEELSRPADQIHFVSDVIAELDAAAAAGMKTSLCLRPGNPPKEFTTPHDSIHSFDEITF